MNCSYFGNGLRSGEVATLSAQASAHQQELETIKGNFGKALQQRIAQERGRLETERARLEKERNDLKATLEYERGLHKHAAEQQQPAAAQQPQQPAAEQQQPAAAGPPTALQQEASLSRSPRKFRILQKHDHSDLPGR